MLRVVDAIGNETAINFTITYFAPVITAQPSSVAIPAGSNTVFEVTATGSKLSYQWQVDAGNGFTDITDGGVYSGAATPMLSITEATTAMNGYKYRIVVSGILEPSVTSSSVTLNVYVDLSDSVAPSIIQINGKPLNAGTNTTTTNNNGQTNTTVTLNTGLVQNILNTSGSDATLTIPVTEDSDVAGYELTGQLVKLLENRSAKLELMTNSITFSLLASDINIDTISQEFGADVSLEDVKVRVEIAELDDAMAKVVEDSADKGSFAVMIKPVEISISVTCNGKTETVSRFSSYVERIIEIPDGVDPAKITTAIVIQPDGTYRHVPTKVEQKDGKYYAVISSLTNSIYTVVYNQVKFADMENHWAEEAVNDLGSRMIVTGYDEKNYAPNREITRAEFAAIIVRALGLPQESGNSTFKDVKASDWYCGYVNTATDYGIILGYGDGSFHPDDNITREQAMTMLARAMKITGLKADISEQELDSLFTAYTDSSSIASYAKSGIGACIKMGLVNGESQSTLTPKRNITRAEAAVFVERLLRRSGLI